MSKRSPQSSSRVAERRHWLLVAIVGLAVIALWAGQPALAADSRPQVNQTVPPATRRPEVPPPGNKDKKDNKADENKAGEATTATEQAAAEPTTVAVPETAAEAAPEATAEPAAEAAATAEQTPESLPETGGEASLPLLGGVAGAALLVLAGAAFVTRRSA